LGGRLLDRGGWDGRQVTFDFWGRGSASNYQNGCQNQEKGKPGGFFEDIVHIDVDFMHGGQARQEPFINL
jgi:hypothetical protein